MTSLSLKRWMGQCIMQRRCEKSSQPASKRKTFSMHKKTSSEALGSQRVASPSMKTWWAQTYPPKLKGLKHPICQWRFTAWLTGLKLRRCLSYQAWSEVSLPLQSRTTRGTRVMPTPPLVPASDRLTHQSIKLQWYRLWGSKMLMKSAWSLFSRALSVRRLLTFSARRRLNYEVARVRFFCSSKTWRVRSLKWKKDLKRKSQETI